MKVYYVYILECSDGSYYTGVTNNLEKRVAEHKFGLDKKAYTYKRLPVKLVWSNSFTDVYQAIEREKQIKGWVKRKKQALIKEDFAKLKRLSNE